MRHALAAMVLGLLMAGQAAAQLPDFRSIDRWDDNDQRAALAAFCITCPQLDAPEWKPICRLGADSRSFFELVFRPVLIGTPPALFTGYHESELEGSPARIPPSSWPPYARPPELREGLPHLRRAQIKAAALRGRGLEIAWLDDSVEADFLQIQGAGGIRLPDGEVIRLGYAGRNGHAQRADIFYGSGDAAGIVKDGGWMIVLVPIDQAIAALREG